MIRHTLLALVLVGFAAPRANADLMLTTAGSNLGFTLTNFITGFTDSSGFGAGPLGIGFPSSGGVLVSDYPGNVRFFPNNVNGQTLANATVTTNHGFGRAFDIVTTPTGTVYMTQRDNGTVVRLNGTGTTATVINTTGMSAPHGIVVNPTNGHLLISSYTINNIYDVNPATGATTVLFNASLDGITINSAGTVLYGAVVDGSGDRLRGYSLTGTVGTVVFDSGILSGDPDGSALGTGTLAGFVYVNTTDGKVIQIRLSDNQQTLIASGGSRGDFVTVDPTNGTLLLTQSDRIVRLSAPAGGGFGTAAAVPEPATLAVVGLLGLSTLALRRRRRAKMA